MSVIEKFGPDDPTSLYWTEKITLVGAADTLDYGYIETERTGFPDPGEACLAPAGDLIWVRNDADPRETYGLDVYDEINEMYANLGFVILELEEPPA